MNVKSDHQQKAFALAQRASEDASMDRRARNIFRAIAHQLWLASGSESEEVRGARRAGMFRCQNCTEKWYRVELVNVDNIPGIHERVAPGEPMPAGECPECGALCHEVTK